MLNLFAPVLQQNARKTAPAQHSRLSLATLKRQRIATAALQHKPDLADVIELCGAGIGADSNAAITTCAPNHVAAGDRCRPPEGSALLGNALTIV
jgi:hypothetical protein